MYIKWDTCYSDQNKKYTPLLLYSIINTTNQRSKNNLGEAFNIDVMHQ